MLIFTDFATIIGGVTLLAGVGIVLDACIFKKRRLAKDPNAPVPFWAESARSYFPLLLIVFLLRAFIGEPFRIPSGSMKPSLLEGDFILVNKVTYGMKLPVVGTKFFNNHSPKAGDVIVFRFPLDPKTDFIKRVVAVPGDRVTYQDKTVYVNGKALDKVYQSKDVDQELTGYNWPVDRYLEKQGNMQREIFTRPEKGRDMPERVVPEGQYFVMGDNRDNSDDSRSWGFVDENLIIGKAFFVWMSWDSSNKDIRWSRVGLKLEGKDIPKDEANSL